MHEDDPKKLIEVVERLSHENAAWRTKTEEAEAEIRSRAPEADGMSLEAAVSEILNQRDSEQDRIQELRQEMKKILRLLLSGDPEEAKKQLNIYLFKDTNKANKK